MGLNDTYMHTTKCLEKAKQEISCKRIIDLVKLQYTTLEPGFRKHLEPALEHAELPRDKGRNRSQSLDKNPYTK